MVTIIYIYIHHPENTFLSFGGYYGYYNHPNFAGEFTRTTGPLPLRIHSVVSRHDPLQSGRSQVTVAAQFGWSWKAWGKPWVKIFKLSAMMAPYVSIYTYIYNFVYAYIICLPARLNSQVSISVHSFGYETCHNIAR